jgi:energy-coupling factor transport system permease protein
MHRLDPVTKTVWVFAMSFLAFGTFFFWIQFAIFLLVMFVGLAWARIGVRDLWRATKWLGLACVCFFLIQTFMLRVPGQRELFQVGPKVVYLETVDYSAAVSLRIFTIFLASFIFIRTTHPRDLAVGFVQILRIPYRIPYAFFIALRIIPLIEEEARTIREAHRVRGIGEKTTFRDRIDNIKRFTVPLLVRALRQASVMSHSMESRGFGAHPTRHYVEGVEMTKTGKLVTWSCIGLVVLWYCLVFAGIIRLKYSVA